VDRGEARPEEGPTLDVALLRGFSFRCRDDCGLCCFAEPRVRATERARLLQIAPQTEWVERDGAEFLTARPDGGACQFLRARQCTVHDARPSPCREFPITVHVGTRLQSTAVLSCPGMDAEGLARWDAGKPAEIRGLDAELAAVRGRVDATAARRMREAVRRRSRIARRLQREGRWVEDDVVRSRVGKRLPFPDADSLAREDLPSADDGLDLLPLFFGGHAGPLALASGVGGWQLLELRATGGIERTLAIVPPPERPPEMTADGRAALETYLRYWLARDLLLGHVHLAMLGANDGSVEDWVRSELRHIGGTALARADVLVRARRGEPRRLTEVDVLEGIRATDQDLLDRESWGDRL
jgi:Fe-S-cluster containining protein